MGQRVLCYDKLGRCPRYVEVSGASTITGEVRWVKVSLADGTALTLTANHPVQPHRASHADRPLPNVDLPVKAIDLKPGLDCLMVMKMLPESVLSVQAVEPPEDKDGGKGVQASAPQQRICLTLPQPERHDVFVAPAGMAMEAATIAVGSSDAGTQDGYAKTTVGLVTRRTFIDIAEETNVVRRASSAPPSLNGKQRTGAVVVQQRVLPGGSECQLRPSNGADNGGLRRILSESDISTSNPSSVPFDAEFQVGTSRSDSAAHLSDLLWVQRSGLKSLGSLEHASGTCRVCVFEHRSKSCYKGLLCNHCHEKHELLPKLRKSGAQRRTVKLLHPLMLRSSGDPKRVAGRIAGCQKHAES